MKGGDAKRHAHVEVLEQSMLDYVSFIHRKALGMRVGLKQAFSLKKS